MNENSQGHFDYRAYTAARFIYDSGLDMSDEERATAWRRSLQYRELGRERENFELCRLLRDIDAGRFSKAGKVDRWATGWQENFEEFGATYDIRALVPRYIRPFEPVRIGGALCETENPNFERDWYRIFFGMVAENFLLNAERDGTRTIYEFGCGSCWNLAMLGEMAPKREIVGLDWADPSVKLANLIGYAFGQNIRGEHFDFFKPDESAISVKGGIVLTVGALEQTGDRFTKFIDWVIKQRAHLCVHIEPIIEWLEPQNIVDYTAIRFMQAREYWHGFPAYMQRLVNFGKAEVVYQKRTGVGSRCIEGYMLYVWRPT